MNRLLILMCCLLMALPSPAEPDQSELTPVQASRLARLALLAIPREFPNKPEHVMNGSGDIVGPRALHPAFYGSYDWHSSVHGHWMLVRLLKVSPGLPVAGAMRAILRENLTAEKLRVEAAYFRVAGRQSFERPYGWAWLLKLSEELHGWDDPEGREWAQNLQPLADVIVANYLNFFPKQKYPIRSGVHSDTAFGLAFALDYARALANSELEALILERSLAYYGQDADYPAAWEPGGDHFLSPCLTVADLMRRVLPPARFQEWLRRYLPGLPSGQPMALLTPAVVTDRSDPKLVHLDGLNLSRAWSMRGVACALPVGDPSRRVLREAALRHACAGLEHVSSGDYSGEHWLASFAVFLLSAPSP